MEEIYKTPLYDKAFTKFIKSGMDNLTPDERDELNSGKSDYGYRYPSNWDNELFKNISVSSVIFRETDHRQPGKSINYDTLHVKLFASKMALEDPTFSVVDELLEAVIEKVCEVIDRQVVSTDETHFIRGMAKDNNYAFVDTQFPKAITEDDLVEMIRRHTNKTDLKWYMNSNTGLSIANNPNYISVPGAKSNPTPTVILGYPVVYNEYMPNIESSNIPVILANMKDSYILDIKDDVYLSRTSSTANDQGKTVEGIMLDVTFMIGGCVVEGNRYRCLRVR